jgi:hypothetical protein
MTLSVPPTFPKHLPCLHRKPEPAASRLSLLRNYQKAFTNNCDCLKMEEKKHIFPITAWVMVPA